MRLRNTNADYGAVSQALHWLTVVFVAFAWLSGIVGDELPAGAQKPGLFVHIFTGLAILAVMAARLGWRAIDRMPSAEAADHASAMSRWLELAAHLAHVGLYILLVAVPVIGIVLQFARGEALPLFGLTEIASPWLKDRAFAHNVKELHEITAHGLVVLAALHGGAAIAHHWIFRDRTLARMLPHLTK